MNSETIHIYFVPGLAADKLIFRNMIFPEKLYKIHILEWLIPENKESLEDYAQRMANRIVEPNAVLIGVSFGGVVVQEMSRFLKLRKLIIISSVKCRNELPRRLKFAKVTKAYKLVPTGLVLSAKDLTKYSIGPKSKKRLSMYQQYLQVRDKNYLDWAIDNMVNWKRTECMEDVVHIHGDNDPIFPIRYINNAIIIPNGTHIMIITRAREISDKIIEIIQE